MPNRAASTLAAMKILELPACPACGGSELLGFELGAGKRLRRCTGCETVSAGEYADPSEVYVDGYMFGEAGDFGLDVRHPLFQSYLARVAQRRIRLIERATGVRRGSLLDVGSGTGEVMMAARDRGWRTQGVEPERTAARMALDRGLDVTVSSLEDSGLPERSYDVVSAFHVLEHIPDSRSFLETMSRWARPGGYLVLEVPNWNSSQRRRLGSAWPGLRPLEHLVHFTPTTLQRTLRSVGLEPLLVRSPAYIGPPQSLQHALDDLVRHGRYRRLVEPLSPIRTLDGRTERYPNRVGWSVLRATEAVYDWAGVGAVVLCVASTP
jgi:SAM-dependent methyltransferase